LQRVIMTAAIRVDIRIEAGTTDRSSNDILIEAPSLRRPKALWRIIAGCQLESIIKHDVLTLYFPQIRNLEITHAALPSEHFKIMEFGVINRLWKYRGISHDHRMVHPVVRARGRL